MFSKKEAETLVQNIIKKWDTNLIVIPEDTVELNFGWIIYYDSKEYVLELRETYGMMDPVDHIPVGGFYLMIIDKFKKQEIDYSGESNLKRIKSIMDVKVAILEYQKKNNYEPHVERMYSPNTIYAYKKENSEAEKLWNLCFGYNNPELLNKYKFLKNNFVCSLWKLASRKFLVEYAINRLKK